MKYFYYDICEYLQSNQTTNGKARWSSAYFRLQFTRKAKIRISPILLESSAL